MDASRRIVLRAGAAAAGALALPAARAQAEDYPNKPIRIINPYPPGGIVDVLARLLGDRLQRAWSQPVLVEAKPGAGGNIGTAFVARAKGDPYTLLMGASGPLAANVTLFRNLGYDPLKDLTPITLVAATPLVLTLSPSAKAASYPELVALLKARKGEIPYGSSGAGTPQHLTAELFQQRVGVQANHIPYKGGAPSVNGMLGGEVAFSFENLALVLPHVKAGKLRPIAVTSAKRTAELPDVPTMQELGVAGFEARGWYGLLGPADLPEPVVRKINAEAVKALRAPDMVERLAGFGSDSVAGSPEEFRALIAQEIEKWRAVIQTARITAE